MLVCLSKLPTSDAALQLTLFMWFPHNFLLVEALKKKKESNSILILIALCYY